MNNEQNNYPVENISFQQMPSSGKQNKSKIPRQNLISMRSIPFEELQIGFSFSIPIKYITNENSFRVMVCNKGKSLKRNFRVIKHEQHGVFEIARVADSFENETVDVNFNQVKSSI